MNMFLEQIVLILLCSFSSVQLQDNIFSFSPNASVCIGETVTLTCYVYPPAGEDFSSLALLSFNDSTAHSIASINDPANGLTALGYSATGDTSVIPVMGDSARIQLTIDSYQVSDSNTLFGCHGVFDNNGSSVLVIQSYGPSIAAPPSPPTALSVSLTSLSPATCSGSVSVAWTPGASDRSIDMYFLFLNGDLLTPLSSSVNSHSYSINIATDTVYTYSVTANSCAGNSTIQDSIFVQSYVLSQTPPLSLIYDQSNAMLTIHWSITPSIGDYSLLLTYSLSVNYSHSQLSSTYHYTLITTFSLFPATTHYTQFITPHTFTTAAAVLTTISVCIGITHQCGRVYEPDTCTVYSAEYLPTPPTLLPTQATVHTTPATAMPTQPTITEPATSSFPMLLVLIISTILILILLSIVLVMGICMFAMYRKNKQLQSPPKQTPHPYEYIDLNMVSPDTAAIPSVPKDSAYYTPMQSLGTQGNSNVVPPVYANLK